MQKFELSEEMLENVTGGISKKTFLKISFLAASAIVTIAAATIGTKKGIHSPRKNKKQYYILEVKETEPEGTHLVEEF